MTEDFLVERGEFPEIEGIVVRIDGSEKTKEGVFEDDLDRKSTRLNSSHIQKSRMPSSA